MGSAVGVLGVLPGEGTHSPPLAPPEGDALPHSQDRIQCTLRELPAAIEECLYVQERFPLVVDPSGQAMRFLKYQLGSFFRSDDVIAFTKERLNVALAGALQHGKTMTLHFKSLRGVGMDLFDPDLFPVEVVNRPELLKDGVWQSVFRPATLGDVDINELTPSPDFVFIVCSEDDFVPPLLAQAMALICVDQWKGSTPGEGNVEGSSGGDGIDLIAEMYGAKETIRNSIALTEAAFDGDLDELKSWIEKGYHLDSVDGRKHTALSEAACQGHQGVVAYLLEQGADPNTRSDTGRSPLWRASFNGQVEVLNMLLEAGADPAHQDTTSMESVFDVAKSDEVRQILTEWDPSYTAVLKERRRLAILAAMESRIRTQTERDELAKQRLREDLVRLAEAGDLQGLTELLMDMVNEAEQTNTRPRATADVRNSQGQSLLSIAVQRDDEKMVEFLLTHWKTCDKDRWDLAEGEQSVESKVFKTNPNARDMKGWSPTCIAIFHDSRKALRLLLNSGADPNLKSSYNKNAWDLAKDELDAANNIVKSNAEIRQILKDFESENASRLFGKGGVSAAIVGDGGVGPDYEGVGPDGTAMLMNIELNKEADAVTGKEGKSSSKGTKKKKSGGTTAAASKVIKKK